MFDEQPDGDPHGECAAEIHRLQALSDEALDLPAAMFDAYEDGPECYEAPEDCAGPLGKAVNLDEATFDLIADILNKHRPRNSEVTANASFSRGPSGPSAGSDS